MPYTYAKESTTCAAKPCTQFSRYIQVGQRIFHSDKSGKNMHEACAAAQFARPNANPAVRPVQQPISPVEAGSRAGLAAKHAPVAVPMPLTDKERVDMVAQARKEVKLIFGLDNSASEYATYVSMLFHARLQAQQQAFELALSRYIQAKKLGNIEKVQQAKGL